MFKVKFILVLALLALVVQDEVKCSMMDQLMTDLVELSATLIKDADALDETAEKKEAIESGTHTEVADDRSAEIAEAIRTGTLPDLLTCSFDKDACKWKQSTGDEFDWDRRNGGTPSYGTGPKISATGSNGYYMYIDASSTRSPGDMATLISPEVTYATQTCLSFKAHMYGSNIADLRIEKVEVEVEGEGDSKTKIFEKSGNQGNKWLSFTVALPIGGPYKVAITATRGAGYKGDIAIDELKQTPCDLLTCNFDKDACKWKQSTGDEFDWDRRNGGTPSYGTGPKISATGSNGYYMYIETSYPRRQGEEATLISPEVTYATQTCLSFKAHMHGSDIADLRIEKVVGDSKTKIFERSGNQGTEWLSFNVNLPIGGPYKVAITATRGANYEGDIAIDELKQTPCAPTPPPAKGCGNPSIKSEISATRVIGGVEATRGCWPWQTLLLYYDGYLCGGSLISTDWVVTAAHCIIEESASNFKIRVGEQDRRKPEGSEDDIPVKRIIKHPLYTGDGRNLDNDIALMQLSREVEFNQYVKPVSLPKTDIPAGSYCYITGFGQMKHAGKHADKLQQARLFVPSNEVCNAWYKKIVRKSIVTGNMICGGDLGKVGGCYGDSGGPFVCEVNGKWELHGAVNFASWNCDPKAAYTVFARITAYLDWIKQNTGVTG